LPVVEKHASLAKLPQTMIAMFDRSLLVTRVPFEGSEAWADERMVTVEVSPLFNVNGPV
jgi:hypothetical protein